MVWRGDAQAQKHIRGYGSDDDDSKTEDNINSNDKKQQQLLQQQQHNMNANANAITNNGSTLKPFLASFSSCSCAALH